MVCPWSLWPEEDRMGKPEMVFFSDVSILAYESVAYIVHTEDFRGTNPNHSADCRYTTVNLLTQHLLC